MGRKAAENLTMSRMVIAKIKLMNSLKKPGIELYSYFIR